MTTWRTLRLFRRASLEDLPRKPRSSAVEQPIPIRTCLSIPTHRSLSQCPPSRPRWPPQMGPMTLPYLSGWDRWMMLVKTGRTDHHHRGAAPLINQGATTSRGRSASGRPRLQTVPCRSPRPLFRPSSSDAPKGPRMQMSEIPAVLRTHRSTSTPQSTRPANISGPSPEVNILSSVPEQ